MKIKIKGSNEEFRIQDMVHPFLENGIYYLRVIVTDEEHNPTHFLSIMPQDILYRISEYDETIMDEINNASEKHAKIELSRWL